MLAHGSFTLKQRLCLVTVAQHFHHYTLYGSPLSSHTMGVAGRGFHKWWEDSDFLCCRVESPWLFIPFFEVSYLLQRWHFKAVSTGTQVFWEKCLFLLVLAFCPHIKGVLDHWKLSVWKIPTSLKILKTLFLAFKCVQGKLFVNIFLCNISVVHLLYQ